jgi:hypothetical protein
MAFDQTTRNRLLIFCQARRHFKRTPCQLQHEYG